jgi:acylphosphatase
MKHTQKLLLKGESLMTKCIKMLLTLEEGTEFLQKIVQKQSKNMKLEGSAQLIAPDQIKIIVCGAKDKVDDFVDIIHKAQALYSIENIVVEPFLRDRDYRNVFRIIT